MRKERKEEERNQDETRETGEEEKVGTIKSPGVITNEKRRSGEAS